MSRIYKERLSDSPYVDKIGHFRIDGDYSQVCGADFLWNIMLVTQHGRTSLSVWGPETKSALMNFPDDTEFLFIRFKLGRFMPKLPIKNLVDTGIILPEATAERFWLNSAAWQFPTYENADTFVDWLARDGFLAHEPIVAAVLEDHPQDLSPRSVRHRFLRATGLTQSDIRQIERARQTAALLEQGVPILDAAEQAGYADQSHMTRSLKRYIGQTPAQIAHPRK